MGQRDLPLESGKYHVKVFQSEHLGDLGRWTVVRSKKNHFVLTHPKLPNVLLSIPDHPEVARGTLAAELRKCGISHEQYIAACEASSQARSTSASSSLFCPNCGPLVALLETAPETFECPDCQRAYVHQAQGDGSTVLVPASTF